MGYIPPIISPMNDEREKDAECCTEVQRSTEAFLRWFDMPLYCGYACDVLFVPATLQILPRTRQTMSLSWVHRLGVSHRLSASTQRLNLKSVPDASQIIAQVGDGDF
jgi:hypothetical protein